MLTMYIERLIKFGIPVRTSFMQYVSSTRFRYAWQFHKQVLQNTLCILPRYLGYVLTACLYVCVCLQDDKTHSISFQMFVSRVLVLIVGLMRVLAVETFNDNQLLKVLWDRYLQYIITQSLNIINFFCVSLLDLVRVIRLK